MAVNDLTLNQVSTVLAEVVSQATGQKEKAPITTGDFVTVGQKALKVGYDPILNSISQVLSRTIFSVRPYSQHFKGMEMNSREYGNMIRKLTITDDGFEDDARYTLEDGQSIDMFKVKKPNVLQLNFYGANVFEKQSPTIFKDQLDTAFSSPEEFQRFISMLMTNATDQIAQAKEDMARMTIANFIGGKVKGDANNVIHLLREYNAKTGLTLDAQSVYKPENFPAFMKWVYSRIATVTSLMTERSLKYHINVTDHAVMRHTPLTEQKVYLYAPAQFETQTQVLSDIYNVNYLKLADNEAVNFWQSINTPASISVKPTYLTPAGTLTTETEEVAVDNIFGVIFDREAMGINSVNEWSASTPFNAKGGYSNIFWHFTINYWNDFTENGVVLLLD